MQRKGKIFPEFIYVVDKTKAYEFAKAIGDELRQVEGEFFVPIGMMLFVVVQDGESIFKALNVTWKQVFLGGVKLKYHRPMKVGDTLRGKMECIAYNNPGIIELETRYSDEVGNEVLHEISTLIVSGETNGNEVETSRSGSDRNTGHRKQESVLHYECSVDRLAIAWMAVALEDPNLIHVEDRVAQEAGFPTVIAHGTFPLGAIGAMLAQWAGEENMLELDIRLVAPTFPGNSIRVEGSILERVDKKQTVEVVVRQKDQIVARGRAIVNAQERETLRPNSFVQEDLP